MHIMYIAQNMLVISKHIKRATYATHCEHAYSANQASRANHARIVQHARSANRDNRVGHRHR